MKRQVPIEHFLFIKTILLFAAITGLSYAAPSDSAADSLPPLEKMPELKQFIKADYPSQSLKKGLEGSVILELVVNDSGRVDSAHVVKGLSPELDSAAITAARRFSFTPARAGGKPVPVALEYEYKFFITTEAIKLDEFVNLRGVLKERGTRKPIGDALIVLSFIDSTADTALKVPWRKYLEKIGAFSGQHREGSKLVTTTDSVGTFAFKSLPSGKVRLKFPVAGYVMDSVVETVERSKLLTMEYRLMPSGNENEIVVYGRVEKKEIDKQSISLTEVQRIPGFGGDAVKAVQALPGVARASFMSGDIVVRGSANSDTRYFLDGVSIPLLFHFDGLKSTYNSDALSSIDLYPGGFSSRYGNSLGGIVEIKGREAKTDRWHGNADVNLLDASFLVEGPITSKFSLLATARRSYMFNVASFVIDRLRLSLPMTVVPYYWDLVSRLDYAPDADHHMFLTAFASLDTLSFITQTTRGGGSTEAAGARDALAMGMGFQKLIYGYDAAFSSRLKNELRVSIDRITQKFGSTMDFLDYTFYVRDEFTSKLLPDFTLHTGIDSYADSAADTFSVSRRANAPASTKNDLFTNAGGYFMAEYLPLEKVVLTPSFRYDYYTDLQKGQPSFRLAARYNLEKGTALKASIGTYNEKPQPLQSTSPTLGNPGLPLTTGTQSVLGFERGITDLINLDVQAYYNTQMNIPRATDSITPAGIPLNYLGDEKGRMYGLELMVRHQLGKHFFGWIAYSLSRSERQSPVPPPDPGFGGVGGILPVGGGGTNTDYRGAWDPNRWFLFDKDQTHNLQMVVSWKLPGLWEFGARVRYVTGNPITPLLGYTQNTFEYDAGSGRYVPIEGPPRSDRMGPFFQVDARVDKKWIYNSWIFSMYLDVQNLNYFWYNSPELYVYNYDNSLRQTIGSIILPTIGVRAEF